MLGLKVNPCQWKGHLVHKGVRIFTAHPNNHAFWFWIITHLVSFTAWKWPCCISTCICVHKDILIIIKDISVVKPFVRECPLSPMNLSLLLSKKNKRKAFSTLNITYWHEEGGNNFILDGRHVHKMLLVHLILSFFTSDLWQWCWSAWYLSGSSPLLSYTKMAVKMFSAKWRPFCLCLNVLHHQWLTQVHLIITFTRSWFECH